MKKAEKDYKEAISDAANSEKTSKSAESNPKITSEQRYKLKDKSIKDKEEQKKAKERYEESISQLELYRNRYVDNMNEVFKATQNFEQERMLFFKGIFINCHQLLQIQQDQRYEDLFDELKVIINKIDANNDLDWWAQNFGPGTKENWLKLTHFEVK